MLGISDTRILEGFDAAQERPVTLRTNTLKAFTDDISAALDTAHITYERVPWYKDAFVILEASIKDIWALDAYQQGHIYVQSLSSMLPPLVLEPQNGADILDMCAAPGGKTAQIAALTHNTARLTACEMHAPRAEKLAYNLNKQGVVNVNIMRMDARKLDTFFRFDQILLDAPCTGTGTFKTGDSKAESRMTPHLLEKVTRAQRALLDRGLTILKPGGRLVYSTCSVLTAENDEQVTRALQKHRDCELIPITFDGNQNDATQELNGAPTRQITLNDALYGPYALPLLETSLPETLQVCPSKFYEGFYIAAIRKREK